MKLKDNEMKTIWRWRARRWWRVRWGGSVKCIKLNMQRTKSGDSWGWGVQIKVAQNGLKHILVLTVLKSEKKQESPPAWMQEAYRPLHSWFEGRGVNRQTDTYQNITFSHPSDAGGKNVSGHKQPTVIRPPIPKWPDIISGSSLCKHATNPYILPT